MGGACGSQEGWTKVAWLLDQLSADAVGSVSGSSHSAGSGRVATSRGLISAATRRELAEYRLAFERTIVDEVSGVVVSLVDPPLVQVLFPPRVECFIASGSFVRVGRCCVWSL
eukprot:1372810-Rhodomonas_salina.2